MTKFYDMFVELSGQYGDTVSIIILLIGTIGYGIFFIVKNFSSLIGKIIENKLKEPEKKHSEATKYRKNITPELRRELSELAKESHADRVLLFEFFFVFF